MRFPGPCHSERSEESRFTFHVLLLAVCVLLLSACTFPGSVKTTVKIGLSAPFEGLYRDEGYEVLYAIRLAVRERNEAGGLCGRYLVELVALNDFDEPAEAVSQAREMASDPGIMGVLGGWSPATAGAAAAEYAALKLPFLAPQADPAALGREAGRYTRATIGARRAAVLSGPANQDLALADAFEKAFVAGGGTVGLRAAPAGEAWAADLVLAGSDLLFIAADAPRAAGWIARARKAGFTGQIAGGPELGSPIVVDIAGAAAEGASYVSPYPPVPDDPDFAARYMALSGGAPPGPAAAWAYARTRDFLDGMANGVAGSQQGAVCPVRRQAALPPVLPQPGAYMYSIEGGRTFQPAR